MTVWTYLVENHSWYIPTKFEENPANGFGEVENVIVEARQRMYDDRQTDERWWQKLSRLTSQAELKIWKNLKIIIAQYSGQIGRDPPNVHSYQVWR